jgi:hypothetical protein
MLLATLDRKASALDETMLLKAARQGDVEALGQLLTPYETRS